MTRRTRLLLTLLILLSPAPGTADMATIYMTGASHIDLAWKWDYEEAIGVCHNTFRDVMDLMEHYEQDGLPGNPMFYAQSQAQAYEWMEVRYPELFARIREWIEKGLWEVVGGMWVESDTNLPSGESLVRQVLYGKLYFLEQLGVDVRVAWLPDTFGYSAGLPQIFKKAGIDYFACTKVNWNDTHPPKKHMFRWVAPDGSDVITYLSIGHYNDIPIPPFLDQLDARLAAAHPDIPFYLFYVGVGDHGGGVFQIFMDLAVAMREAGYPIVFDRTESFFQALEAHGVEDVIQDEMYVETHRGTYTSRARVKERNRESEKALETLEKAATLSLPYGGTFPRDDLDRMWKKVLLNQFHDVLPGSAIDIVYEDFDADHDFVASRSEALTADALAAIGARVDTAAGPAGEPLLVFNPLSWARSEPVSLPMDEAEAAGLAVLDGQGRALPTQYSRLDGALWFRADDVPSLGYRTFYLSRGEASGAVETGGLSATAERLENDFLAASLDPDTGLLVSLRDKRAGDREVIQPGEEANALQVYFEGYSTFPAWNLAHDKYGTPPYRLREPITLELVESGPLRAVVRAVYEHLGMLFEQRTVLWADLPYLEFQFHADNWGAVLNRLLKVSFPLELVNHAKQATYEVPYAALTRTHDGSVANWEASGQKWVNVQDDGPGDAYGVALLSGNKYGFDLANDGPGEGLSDGRANILRMTLLKSSGQPLPGEFGLPLGGPVTDWGSFDSRYALYPHGGPWEESGVVARAHDFNYPFRVHRPVRHFCDLPALLCFLAVSPSTVIATVLKAPERPAADGELIVRLFETARRDTTATIAFPTKWIRRAREVDLLERDMEGARPVDVRGDALTLDVGHDEIVTLRLSYAEKASGGSRPDAALPGDEGGCGCSSVRPSEGAAVRVGYAVAFWSLLLLLPFVLGRCRSWTRARDGSSHARPSAGVSRPGPF